MQDWNLADQMAGLENVGPENALYRVLIIVYIKTSETLSVIKKHHYFM